MEFSLFGHIDNVLANRTYMQFGGAMANYQEVGKIRFFLHVDGYQIFAFLAKIHDTICSNVSLCVCSILLLFLKKTGYNLFLK